MTCVVAVIGNDGTFCLAGDSAAVEDNMIVKRATPKVFQIGEFAIGYCHSFRLGQIIEYFFKPPVLPEGADHKELMSYMVTKFIPTLKKALEKNDYPLQEDEKSDWSLIVCVRNSIFTIESDFHVGSDYDNFAAIGAGAEYALGSICSETDRNNAVEAAERALRAAEYFSPNVIGPFNFIVLS